MEIWHFKPAVKSAWKSRKKPLLRLNMCYTTRKKTSINTFAIHWLGMARAENTIDRYNKTYYMEGYQITDVAKWQYPLALKLSSYGINPALVHSFHQILLIVSLQTGNKILVYIKITKGDFPKCKYVLVCQDMTLPGHAVNSVKHVITATQFHFTSVFVSRFAIICTFSRVGKHDCIRDISTQENLFTFI